MTGFWIAGLVLVMLASGLPWAGTWGSAFKWARAELGLVDGRQDWKIGSGAKPEQSKDDHGHRAHEITAVPEASAPTENSLPLSTFVAKAQAEAMAFPVLVLPPHSPQRFGPPTGDLWTVKSEAQNRPLVRSVTFDPVTGAELARSDFSDKHPLDRAINYGIAWHEGQLFGLPDQQIGLATAIALFALSVLGVTMWLKRRPQARLGAPLASGNVRGRWVSSVTLLVLAIFLPLFGLSLGILLILDLVIRRGRAVLRP